MKKTSAILAIILFVMAGGIGCKPSNTQSDDLITVDVTKNYPDKELILQDFMDVEYIALETSDEFLTQGIVEAIGKEFILVRNLSDGDIFIFDRAGKGLRKINRFGQSGEEYSQVNEIILDEDNNEMFVKDYPARKILVYDLYGNFKRSFKFIDTSYYDFTFNYDQNHLISYRNYLPVMDNERPEHFIISKQDGSIIREIQIPFKEIKTPTVREEDLTITPGFYLTIPCQGNWGLVNPSSDTVYTYLPDGNLIPFIVRTPSIHSMDTEVFLFLSMLTDRYCFMYTMKKEVDFTTFKGFPTTDLVYDKQENALFKYTIYNDDFSDKRQMSLNLNPLNHEIATCQALEAYQLVEAYEKGQLKGELKEIAATLDEESNSVIMLVKHKRDINN